jgi:hypothetical protein
MTPCVTPPFDNRHMPQSNVLTSSQNKSLTGMGRVLNHGVKSEEN